MVPPVRWIVTSVGIAQGPTPKKTSLICPRKGEVCEKLVLEGEATGFQDRGWDRLGEKTLLRGLNWRQTGV